MAFAGMCPYLKNAKKVEVTVCECARFTFPDRQARRDVLYGCCGHPSAWRNCVFKLAMDKYYDRKYSEEESGQSRISAVSTTDNCCVRR